MAAAVGRYQQLCEENREDGAGLFFGMQQAVINAALDIVNEGVIGSELVCILVSGGNILHGGRSALVSAPTVCMQARKNIIFDSPSAAHPVRLLDIQTLALNTIGNIHFHNVLITAPEGAEISGRITAGGRVIVFVDQVPISAQDRALIDLVRKCTSQGVPFEVRQIIEEPAGAVAEQTA